MKLIIFDLDGVLVDSRDIHYHSLNNALATIGKEYVISYTEHLSTYDGLPTKEKLKLLTKYKGLPQELHKTVYDFKQIFTMKLIEQETPDNRIIGILSILKESGYLLACASNSIRETLEKTLEKKGFLGYMDYILSCENIRPKPNPEIYLRVMAHFGIGPLETAIVEDSPTGKKAAYASGATVISVTTPSDLRLSLLEYYLNKISKGLKWDGNLNVVIPMAGLGSRFAEKGYTFPKPLIEVNGKMMIQLVVENLNIETNGQAQFIFVINEEHDRKFNIKSTLRLISPNCKVVVAPRITEGAACSILLAKQFINNETPLLLANSDQYVEFDIHKFIHQAMGTDGAIQTFEAIHPKWSYSKTDPSTGLVTSVAEKNPISNTATTGIYFWKNGSSFVKYAERMIQKNIRVNNEFYTCPVFNEAIADSLKIKNVPCKRMWGIGTPEDLEYYLRNYSN